MSNQTRALYYFAIALMQTFFLLPSYPSDYGLGYAFWRSPVGWPIGGVIPYSLLWSVIDPLYWTQLPYKLWCLGIIGAMSVAYWVLYKRGRIGYYMILAWQFQNCLWWAFLNTQNFTVTLLAPLAFIWWPFAIWPLIVKVPIGWSFNLSDPHWHCVFSWPGNWVTNYPECTSFNRWGFDGISIYIYLLILAWCIIPAAWGFYCRDKTRPERFYHWLHSKLVCDCADCKGYTPDA